MKRKVKVGSVIEFGTKNLPAYINENEIAEVASINEFYVVLKTICGSGIHTIKEIQQAQILNILNKKQAQIKYPTLFN